MGKNKSKSIKDKITHRLAKYKKVKDAKIGTPVCCPSCKRLIIKNTYQKTFCSNKGKGNCKDKFWNLVNPDKRCRPTPYFYNVILNNSALERGYPSFEEMEKAEFEDDGSWDAHQCVTGVCDFCKLKMDYCECGEGATDY